MAAAISTFLILTTLSSTANSQSQSSCLVQTRFDGAKSHIESSPFSTQQQQCIDDYVAGVQHLIPSYDLSQRRFGGSSLGHRAAKPPVLGVGFGTTGTRSLALFGGQLGLRVHHFDPWPDRSWFDLDQLLIQNCTEKGRMGHLNQLNFSQMLHGGSDLFLDTPMAELFLDFYAASPESKVILTLRDSEHWAESRAKLHGTSPLPVQSPCGQTFSSLATKEAAKLFDLHQTLVRCMVPQDQLLEVNMDLPLNSTQIAQLLGVQLEFEVPFPKVGNFDKRPDTWINPFTEADPHGEAVGASSYRLGDRFAICITGQIRRLHLETKMKRLIEPALAAGHNVEVYLVLDPRVDDTAFVHRAAGTNVGEYTITEGSFYSLNETVDIFPSNITVVLDPFIPKDYPVDPRYAASMNQDLAEKVGKNPREYCKERSKSHMRQWEALDRCWQLILARDPEPPNMAMRLRDDSAVMEEFVPPLESMPPGIYAASCESWHGINDKGSIISGAGEVQKYFTKPLELMRHNFSKVLAFQLSRTKRAFNPESVLFNTMALSNVAIHNLTYFPILPVSMLQDIFHPEQQAKMCYLQNEHRLQCCSVELWQSLEGQHVTADNDEYLCVPASS